MYITFSHKNKKTGLTSYNSKIMMFFVFFYKEKHDELEISTNTKRELLQLEQFAFYIE